MPKEESEQARGLRFEGDRHPRPPKLERVGIEREFRERPDHGTPLTDSSCTTQALSMDSVGDDGHRVANHRGIIPRLQEP
jgi:hypothetical protein